MTISSDDIGHTSAEAVGQSLDIIIPEPLRPRHWEGYHRVAATGTTRYGSGDLLAAPALRRAAPASRSSSPSRW